MSWRYRQRCWPILTSRRRSQFSTVDLTCADRNIFMRKEVTAFLNLRRIHAPGSSKSKFRWAKSCSRQFLEAWSIYFGAESEVKRLISCGEVQSPHVWDRFASTLPPSFCDVRHIAYLTFHLIRRVFCHRRWIPTARGRFAGRRAYVPCDRSTPTSESHL